MSILKTIGIGFVIVILLLLLTSAIIAIFAVMIGGKIGKDQNMQEFSQNGQLNGNKKD